MQEGIDMEHVRVDVTEPVVWLTFERPPLNVLNIEMLEELSSALDTIATQSKTSIVVISGAGDKAFSAGVDIADHQGDKIEPMLNVFHGVLRKMATLPQVTLAAVDGMCLGGGFELALMCDLCIATDRSRFGLPEINLACFPPAALFLLAPHCGRHRAADWILTGDIQEAQVAYDAGVISHVYHAENYAEDLRTYVASLSKKSPQVLRMTVQAMREEVLGTFEKSLSRVENIYLQKLTLEPDMHEGIAAFMEKREPKWRDQ
jgi:cyclohexa-1,5-dienecarbonyl-CoA hydratase